ncbi:Uncharacterized protein APZ42_020899 [Daphnia magna]|uniref:Uncharacterized protein n=1 Tax=Daphnia magna TaxID=35525 RepID=A0A0P5ESR1_9CRUS|nr:Uncharacterized protein APZ42_020899 [Daphnia magna]
MANTLQDMFICYSQLDIENHLQRTLITRKKPSSPLSPETHSCEVERLPTEVESNEFKSQLNYMFEYVLYSSMIVC